MAVNPFTPDLRPSSGEFSLYQSMRAPVDIVWKNDASKIVSQDEKTFNQGGGGGLSVSQCESFSSHDPDDPRLYQKSWYFATRSGNMGNISGTSNIRPQFSSPSMMTLATFQDPTNIPESQQQLSQQQHYHHHHRLHVHQHQYQQQRNYRRNSNNNNINNNNNSNNNRNRKGENNGNAQPQRKVLVNLNPTPAPSGLIEKQNNYFQRHNNNNNNNTNTRTMDSVNDKENLNRLNVAPMTFSMGFGNDNNNNNDNNNKVGVGQKSEENDEKSNSILGKELSLKQKNSNGYSDTDSGKSMNKKNNTTVFSLSKFLDNNEIEYDSESVLSKTNLLKEFQQSVMSAVSSISGFSFDPILNKNTKKHDNLSNDKANNGTYNTTSMRSSLDYKHDNNPPGNKTTLI